MNPASQLTGYIVEGPRSPADPAIEELAADGDKAEVRARLAPHKQRHAADPQPFFIVEGLSTGGIFVCLQFAYLPGNGSIWRGAQRILNHTVAFILPRDDAKPRTAWEGWSLGLGVLDAVWGWQDTRPDGPIRGAAGTELMSIVAGCLGGPRVAEAPRPAKVPTEADQLMNRLRGDGAAQINQPLVREGGRTLPVPGTVDAIGLVSWAMGTDLVIEGRFSGLSAVASFRTTALAQMKLSSSGRRLFEGQISWEEVLAEPPGAIWLAPALSAAERNRKRAEKLRLSLEEALAAADPKRLQGCAVQVRDFVTQAGAGSGPEQTSATNLLIRGLSAPLDFDKQPLLEAWCLLLQQVAVPEEGGGR